MLFACFCKPENLPLKPLEDLDLYREEEELVENQKGRGILIFFSMARVKKKVLASQNFVEGPDSKCAKMK